MKSALFLVLGAAFARALAMPGWLGVWGWPLVFVAVALRVLAWRQRPRLWQDYLGGVVFWTVSFSFLGHVHPWAPVGAALILGSCWWVEGVLFRILHGRFCTHWAAMLALPLAEYLRMTWFYLAVGGVPWASFGLALEPSPFYPMARVLGEFGLVLVAVLGGVLLASLFCRPWRPAVALPLVALFGLGGPWFVHSSVPSETLRCLAVQPNVSVEDKNILLSANRFFDRQNALTRQAFAAGESPDLVLWAETMWPYPAAEEDAEGFLRRPWPDQPDEIQKMSEVALRQRVMVRTVLAAAPHPSYFLTGAHFYYPVGAEELDQRYSPRNTEFVLFDADGHLLQHFSKQKLVPFGETLPFGGHFPGAEWFREYAHHHFGLRPDFQRTTQTGPLRVETHLPELGGAVCWENVFERPFRVQTLAGARAFVILSNEDWFGLDGLEMKQMVAATRLRAAENGLALLRVTNTGQSCLVHADGRVDLGLDPGKEGWWSANLPLKDSQALPQAYLQWGWAIAPLYAVLALLLALLAVFSPSKKALEKARNLSGLDPAAGAG